jgi:hypothetical protein
MWNYWWTGSEIGTGPLPPSPLVLLYQCHCTAYLYCVIILLFCYSKFRIHMSRFFMCFCTLLLLHDIFSTWINGQGLKSDRFWWNGWGDLHWIALVHVGSAHMDVLSGGMKFDQKWLRVDFVIVKERHETYWYLLIFATTIPEVTKLWAMPPGGCCWSTAGRSLYLWGTFILNKIWAQDTIPILVDTVLVYFTYHLVRTGSKL